MIATFVKLSLQNRVYIAECDECNMNKSKRKRERERELPYMYLEFLECFLSLCHFNMLIVLSSH